jgi:hypothetical protein
MIQQKLDSAQNSAAKVNEKRDEEKDRNKKMRDIAARLEVTSNKSYIS